VISADGRYVAFDSYARKLVPHDTNGSQDVFLRDLQSGKTTRSTSRAMAARPPRQPERPAAISADGRYVAFASNAPNLVSGDTNRVTDIFLRDRKRGRTVRVSVGPRGRQARRPLAERERAAVDQRRRPLRRVRLLRDQPRLERHQPDAGRFGARTSRGRTMRVSVSSSGRQAKRESGVPVISPDGRFVAFSSYSALSRASSPASASSSSATCRPARSRSPP
jgi:Tol biopolymer transport system component